MDLPGRAILIPSRYNLHPYKTLSNLHLFSIRLPAAAPQSDQGWYANNGLHIRPRIFAVRSDYIFGLVPCEQSKPGSVASRAVTVYLRTTILVSHARALTHIPQCVGRELWYFQTARSAPVSPARANNIFQRQAGPSVHVAATSRSPPL